jgi:hypothetical protein
MLSKSATSLTNGRRYGALFSVERASRLSAHVLCFRCADASIAECAACAAEFCSTESAACQTAVCGGRARRLGKDATGPMRLLIELVNAFSKVLTALVPQPNTAAQVQVALSLAAGQTRADVPLWANLRTALRRER